MGTKLLFAFSHTLTDRIGIGYNLGAEYDGTEAKASMIYSFVIGVSPVDKLGLFFEVYGSSYKEFAPDHRVDAGITYLVTDNLQLDFSGGVGLSKASPDNFISAGLSYRFMKK